MALIRGYQHGPGISRPRHPAWDAAPGDARRGRDRSGPRTALVHAAGPGHPPAGWPAGARQPRRQARRRSAPPRAAPPELRAASRRRGALLTLAGRTGAAAASLWRSAR